MMMRELYWQSQIIKMASERYAAEARVQTLIKILSEVAPEHANLYSQVADGYMAQLFLDIIAQSPKVLPHHTGKEKIFY